MCQVLSFKPHNPDLKVCASLRFIHGLIIGSKGKGDLCESLQLMSGSCKIQTKSCAFPCIMFSMNHVALSEKSLVGFLPIDTVVLKVSP